MVWRLLRRVQVREWEGRRGAVAGWLQEGHHCRVSETCAMRKYSQPRKRKEVRYAPRSLPTIESSMIRSLNL